MSEFCQYFRCPENLLYFNSGSMSLSPTSVIDAVTTEKNKFENNPTEGLFGAWEKLWQVQKNLAKFLDCDPHHLFLRQNVTYALNDFIMALQLPEKSEILVSDLEYGAIIKQCEYKAKLDNLSIREFELHDKLKPSALTEEILLENLEKALSPQTKMVMLSHIMTGTGLKIPLEKIGRLLRSRNIFFVVDGAHGAGAADLHLNPDYLDFYGGNLHKWLMGPKGTGFGWVAQHMHEHLVPRFAGWTTGSVSPYHAAFAEGDEWALRWMICSTVNFSDFLGIDSILKFWNTHGAARINAERKKLYNKTKEQILNATDWTCVSDYPESLTGPLMAFRLPIKMLKPNLMKELYLQNQLVVATPFIRGETVLRLSPNIYNTESEIAQVAQILGRANK